MGDEDNNQNGAKGTFAGVLEPIGKFIGTHSLSVFLVVWYVAVIYPDQKSIEERYREDVAYLVDPSKRTLTKKQTRADLLIAENALFHELRISLRQFNYDGQVVDCERGSTQESVNIDGEEFNNEKSIEVLISDFNKLKSRRENALKVNLVSEFGVVIDSVSDQVIPYMEQLKIKDSKSVADLWITATSGLENEWNTQVESSAIASEVGEYQCFKSLIVRHEGYKNLKDDDLRSIEPLNRDLQTLPKQIERRYENNLKEVLKQTFGV